MGKAFKDNQVLSGSWAQVWFDGELLAECSAINAKITEGREDVQMGIDVGSKLISLKGEGSITVHHVYTTKVNLVKSKIKGKDPRVQIIAKIDDPDAVGGQVERWSFKDCCVTETVLFDWKNGAKAEKTIPFTFPPTKMQLLDSIV